MDRRAMYEPGIIAAEKQNDAGDVPRLWPLREIGRRHRFSILLGVDDAWENRIRADSGAFHMTVLGRSIATSGAPRATWARLSHVSLSHATNQCSRFSTFAQDVRRHLQNSQVQSARKSSQ